MSTILDWGDTAHSRLTRTIRWGDDLLAQLPNVRNGNVPSDLVGEIEDWSESTAYFINFMLDGHSARQLETLGYDPKREIPVDRLSEYDAPRLRSEMSMRVTMLNKWFDELMGNLSATETLHHQSAENGSELISIGAQNSSDPFFDPDFGCFQHEQDRGFADSAPATASHSRLPHTIRTLPLQQRRLS